jgi:hypothetical protein
MTLPIQPQVYPDGSLLTEALFFARVLTPVNTLYAQLQTLLQVDGLQRGSVSGTVVNNSANATGTVTFPTAFGTTPNITFGLFAAAGLLVPKMTSLSASSFGWNVFYGPGGVQTGGDLAFTLHWIGIG